MADLSLERIAAARQHLVLVNHLPARATLAAALDLAEAELMAPVVFRMEPGACWDLGMGDPVPGSFKGLLPAWCAFAQGVAKLSTFVFEDEQAGADSVRRSIRIQCVAWAERAGCRDLATAFRQITVDEENDRIVYNGTRKILTA